MIVQLVFSGLALGSMYALVALGYNITYATSRTVNFAQGQSVMVGAVVAYALYVGAGWPFVPSVLATLLALAALGVLVERVAVRPFLASASIAWLLATIALGVIAENVAMLTFGKDARAFPSSLAQRAVTVLGAGVYPHELLVPVVGVALMVLVELAFRRTLAGRALRAVAFDHDAARLMGIDVTRTISAAYALSSVLAGVAGILLAPLLNVSATMGTTLGLKGFAVAIIGGIESARGIVVAGVLYGIVEAIVAGYLGTGVREIVGFALVVLVLLARPWGLFGVAAPRRV
ncbi:MAG: branched-chain amino acid ABC transporter permease [Candidatus Rokuibacteriota bacterium]|nr:MAG: branched-chain amino acid ABC transporter permease [Candidatus Rokubacteria bacterium]